MPIFQGNTGKPCRSLSARVANHAHAFCSAGLAPLASAITRARCNDRKNVGGSADWLRPFMALVEMASGVMPFRAHTGHTQLPPGISVRGGARQYVCHPAPAFRMAGVHPTPFLG